MRKSGTACRSAPRQARRDSHACSLPRLGRKTPVSERCAEFVTSAYVGSRQTHAASTPTAPAKPARRAAPSPSPTTRRAKSP